MVALLVLLPIALLHLPLRRNAAALRFQLLLDLVLLALPGRFLVAGAHLGPGVPGGAAWGAPVTVAGSPEQTDLPLQLAPWWEETRRLVRAGEPPWVTDRIGGGTALYAHGQSGVPFPLQLPVWVLGAADGSDVMAVWKLELAALGAFLLFLRLRARATAAAVGALGYGFSLCLCSWLVSPLAWVVAALPWAWWSLVGTLRGRRREAALLALLLGVTVGWSVNPESGAFLWLGTGLAGMALGAGRWRRLRRLLAPFLAGGAVAGVGALPTLAAIAGSAKLAGASAEVAPSWLGWPLRLRLMSLIAVPWREGNPAAGTWLHPFPQAAVAVGIGTLPLVLILAAPPRRRHRRVALAAVVVGGLAAALLYLVPGFADVGHRLPGLRLMTWARGGFLVSWALAALAALGCDAWLRRRRPARLLAAAAIVQATVLGLGATRLPGVQASAVWGSGWAPAAALLALAPGGAAVGLPLAVAAEEVLQARGLPARWRPSPPSPFEHALHERVSPGERILGTRGAFPANLAAEDGLADLRAHDPVRPLALARLHAALGAARMDLPGEVTRPWAGLAGAWGVAWLAAPQAGVEGPAAAGWEEAWRGRGGRIYRNMRALPLVRLVSRVVASPGDPGEGGWEGVDFASTAVADTVVTLGGRGSLRVVHASPSRWGAEVHADGPLLAVLHVPIAPGWQARVDGTTVPIRVVDLAAMAVEVPAGAHRVEWRYFPPLLVPGVLLTLGGLAACALLAWRRRIP
jgi:hypothetical protein